MYLVLDHKGSFHKSQVNNSSYVLQSHCNKIGNYLQKDSSKTKQNPHLTFENYMIILLFILL